MINILKKSIINLLRLIGSIILSFIVRLHTLFNFNVGKLINQNEPASYILMFLITITIYLLLLLWEFYIERKNLLDEINNLKDKQEHKEHDTKTFKNSDNIMDEINLQGFINRLNCHNSYTDDKFRQAVDLIHFFERESNQYIIKDLNLASQEFIDSLKKLNKYISMNFFKYPEGRKENPQCCLYPELNIDRGGSGKEEEREQYSQYQDELNALVKEVKSNYKNYRNKVKKTLSI